MTRPGRKDNQGGTSSPSLHGDHNPAARTPRPRRWTTASYAVGDRDDAVGAWSAWRMIGAVTPAPTRIHSVTWAMPPSTDHTNELCPGLGPTGGSGRRSRPAGTPPPRREPRWRPGPSGRAPPRRASSRAPAAGLPQPPPSPPAPWMASGHASTRRSWPTPRPPLRPCSAGASSWASGPVSASTSTSAAPLATAQRAQRDARGGSRGSSGAYGAVRASITVAPLRGREAQLFTLPSSPPPVVVAGSSTESARRAGRLGDGSFGVVTSARPRRGLRRLGRSREASGRPDPRVGRPPRSRPGKPPSGGGRAPR